MLQLHAAQERDPVENEMMGVEQPNSLECVESTVWLQHIFLWRAMDLDCHVLCVLTSHHVHRYSWGALSFQGVVRKSDVNNCHLPWLHNVAAHVVERPLALLVQRQTNLGSQHSEQVSTTGNVLQGCPLLQM